MRAPSAERGARLPGPAVLGSLTLGSLTLGSLALGGCVFLTDTPVRDGMRWHAGAELCSQALLDAFPDTSFPLDPDHARPRVAFDPPPRKASTSAHASARSYAAAGGRREAGWTPTSKHDGMPLHMRRYETVLFQVTSGSGTHTCRVQPRRGTVISTTTR